MLLNNHLRDISGETAEMSAAELEFFGAMAESSSVTDDGHGRGLGALPSVVTTAWDRIKSDYPSANTVSLNSPFGGQDRIKIENVGGTCWIVGEESNDAGDWWKNFDLGHENIAGAGYSYSERYCASWGWRGCNYKYRTVRVEERGFDGFVKPFNTMRVAIENKMNSICKTSTKFIYAGYSRGAGLVQVVALSHMRRGITTSSDNVQLITFGSPRALEYAGALEEFLDDSHRVVKSRGSWWGSTYDPVTTVPAGWWGFDHVGRNRYPGSVGYNSPTFGANYLEKC